MAKKVIFILAQNGFQDQEFSLPSDILKKRGMVVKTAASKSGQAVSSMGQTVNIDYSLDQVRVKDFDAIVFVGGPGAIGYLSDSTAHQLARDFKKLNRYLAAICVGPSILANAGVIIGKTVTAFPSEEENITNRGAFYTGMPTEVDGLVITGKDPNSAKEFGEKLAYALEE